VLNWHRRADKKLYVQSVCAMPIVKTMTNDNTMPNGDNLIVAYMEFECRNQEDGSVVNRASTERGRLGVMHYTNRMVRLEKDQLITSPKDVNAQVKQDINYDKLVNGIVPVGTVVTQNDALIGRVESIVREFGTTKYVDRSETYKGTEPLIVLDVIHGVSEEDGKRFIKLKLASYRPLGLGSKISSRHGNKSIISSVIPAADLPFTRSGIIPDLIITTHGFPKRMIFSQLIETAMAALCARRGGVVDATAFSALDLEFLDTELKKYGIKYMGYEVMVNGRTGEEINALICSGPTYYLRLQKFPNDSMHAAAQGPTDAVTRQPIKGRNVDGGLKLGEMEKDAMCSHGIMTALYEKFSLHSDNHTMYICRRCNYHAVYSKNYNIYKCKICKDNADIVRVPSTWMTNVIQHNLLGSYIDIKYVPEPLTFYK
jgi:DNA-directed RNA polymerase II subunit RPB2